MSRFPQKSRSRTSLILARDSRRQQSGFIACFAQALIPIGRYLFASLPDGLPAGWSPRKARTSVISLRTHFMHHDSYGLINAGQSQRVLVSYSMRYKGAVLGARQAYSRFIPFIVHARIVSYNKRLLAWSHVVNHMTIARLRQAYSSLIPFVIHALILDRQAYARVIAFLAYALVHLNLGSTAARSHASRMTSVNSSRSPFLRCRGCYPPCLTTGGGG